MGMCGDIGVGFVKCDVTVTLQLSECRKIRFASWLPMLHICLVCLSSESRVKVRRGMTEMEPEEAHFQCKTKLSRMVSLPPLPLSVTSICNWRWMPFNAKKVGGCLHLAQRKDHNLIKARRLRVDYARQGVAACWCVTCLIGRPSFPLREISPTGAINVSYSLSITLSVLRPIPTAT